MSLRHRNPIRAMGEIPARIPGRVHRPHPGVDSYLGERGRPLLSRGPGGRAYGDHCSAADPSGVGPGGRVAALLAPDSATALRSAASEYRTHMIEIVSAVGTMALVGADPALRQSAHVKAGAVIPSIDIKGGLEGPLRDAELRPKVGCWQVLALQKEPGHARGPMAKTVDYLLFAIPGVVLKAPAKFSLAPFAVSLSAAAHGDLSARRWAGRGKAKAGCLARAARQARPATGA